MALYWQCVGGGPLNLTEVRVDPVNFPFEKGTPLWQDSSTGICKPASAMNAQGSAELNQLGFASRFVGIANESVGMPSGAKTYRVDDNKKYQALVATTGQFEAACPAQAWTANQPVGIYSGTGATDVCSNTSVHALQGGATLSAMIGLAKPSKAALETFRNSGTMTKIIVDIAAAKPFATAPAAGTYTGTSGT